MELTQMKRLGKELAKYLVYCCEHDDYVTRMDHFRLATSRQSLIEAIYSLYQAGGTESPQRTKPIKLTDHQIEELYAFIRTKEIQEVKDLHTSMIRDIATFDLEKIHEIEEYVGQLLDDLHEGEMNR